MSATDEQTTKWRQITSGAEYIAFALRTENEDTMVKPLRKPSNVRLLHAAMGMCTEAGELVEAVFPEFQKIDKVNVLEECGDVLWYMAIVCDVVDTSFDDLGHTVDMTGLERHTTQLVVQTSHFLDLMKKVVYYETEIETISFKLMLIHIYKHVRGIIISINPEKTVHDVMSSNIYKLRVRYPDKFAYFEANNRKLEQERKALERGGNGNKCSQCNKTRIAGDEGDETLCEDCL